jgi:hypothetical protein
MYVARYPPNFALQYILEVRAVLATGRRFDAEPIRLLRKRPSLLEKIPELDGDSLGGIWRHRHRHPRLLASEIHLANGSFDLEHNHVAVSRLHP